MNKSTRKVPEIRFKGFNEDWEQRELGQIAEKYISGGTPKTSNKEYWDGEIPWIQSSDIVEGKLHNIHVRKFITKNGLKNSAAKIVPPESIAVVTRVGVGKVCLIEFEFTTSQDFLSFSNLKTNKLFGTYLIYKAMFKEKEMTQGTSIKGITKNELLKRKINLPQSTIEQEKVGNLLTILDNTIALHQRKLDKLERLKKGFLHIMLPQIDENVPKLRFADFSENWKQRKLDKVVKITMGQSPNGNNYTEDPNDHILVQGNADIKNGWVRPRVWTKQVTKTADSGDFILSVRAPVGDIGKTQYKVVLGRGVAGIKGNEFIFQTLNKMKDNGFWKRYSTGSTFESINSNDLKEALIKIPDKNEQTKIGDFFKLLDKNIIQNQSKIEKIESLKKAYLQKMFI